MGRVTRTVVVGRVVRVLLSVAAAVMVEFGAVVYAGVEVIVGIGAVCSVVGQLKAWLVVLASGADGSGAATSMLPMSGTKL